MLKWLFTLMLAFSVFMLGVPSMAKAVHLSDQHGSHTHAMMKDCVCPPGHDMPSHDNDPGTCTSSLACMMNCATAPVAVAADSIVMSAISPHSTAFSDGVEFVCSSSYPPFRPPSL